MVSRCVSYRSSSYSVFWVCNYFLSTGLFFASGYRVGYCVSVAVYTAPLPFSPSLYANSNFYSLFVGSYCANSVYLIGLYSRVAVLSPHLRHEQVDLCFPSVGTFQSSLFTNGLLHRCGSIGTGVQGSLSVYRGFSLFLSVQGHVNACGVSISLRF